MKCSYAQRKTGYRSLHSNFPKFLMRKGTLNVSLAAIRLGSERFVIHGNLEDTKPMTELLKLTSKKVSLYKYQALTSTLFFFIKLEPGHKQLN